MMVDPCFVAKGWPCVWVPFGCPHGSRGQGSALALLYRAYGVLGGNGGMRGRGTLAVGFQVPVHGLCQCTMRHHVMPRCGTRRTLGRNGGMWAGKEGMGLTGRSRPSWEKKCTWKLVYVVRQMRGNPDTGRVASTPPVCCKNRLRCPRAQYMFKGIFCVWFYDYAYLPPSGRFSPPCLATASVPGFFFAGV